MNHFALDRYKLLGKSGLRVSPLCLGTMTFGTDWGWGAEKDESRRMFDLYAERGGNFIDTAINYTQGTSETFLGEFLNGRRERFVLGTKFSLNTRPGDPNAGGNHRKNMMQSVETSLKRLGTDYIDLYWVHVWEFRTPVEEVMRALDDLVRQGKVLYVGISDAPAWKVSQANTLAALRGWTPFIALQVEYSLIERAAERELIPMAAEFGVAFTPWAPLGGGVLTGKYGRADLEAPGGEDPSRSVEEERKDVNKRIGRVNERNLAIADEVSGIAGEIGRSPGQVALNWLLQRPAGTIPIVGARKVEQLEDNLGCLDFLLTPEQLERLDAVSRVEMGHPHDFIASDRLKKNLDRGMNIEGGFGVRA